MKKIGVVGLLTFKLNQVYLPPHTGITKAFFDTSAKKATGYIEFIGFEDYFKIIRENPTNTSEEYTAECLKTCALMSTGYRNQNFVSGFTNYIYKNNNTWFNMSGSIEPPTYWVSGSSAEVSKGATFDLRVSNNSSNIVNKTLNLELVYLVRDPTLPYNN